MLGFLFNNLQETTVKTVLNELTPFHKRMTIDKVLKFTSLIYCKLQRYLVDPSITADAKMCSTLINFLFDCNRMAQLSSISAAECLLTFEASLASVLKWIKITFNKVYTTSVHLSDIVLINHFLHLLLKIDQRQLQFRLVFFSDTN